MQLKRAIDKVPGGMMIIPLFIGAILRTFFPNMFQNTVLNSSFTGGMLSGTLPLLAAFYVCLGATIDFRSTGYILKKGGSLWAGKIVTAAIIGLLIQQFTSDQNHLFLGLSALAIVAAFSDTNGGLYMALMGQFSKKGEDVAAYSIMSLESGPFFTMLILGVTGLAHFPLLAFVYALVPLALGMVLGNLDPNMRTFLSKGQDVLIPMFSLALGCGINLKNIVQAGMSGIVLGLAVVAITGIILILLDKLTGGTGLAGVAAASTAGNSAAVPVAVAAIYAGYQGIAKTATVQVAAAVIVTAVLTPIISAWYSKHVAKRKKTEVAQEA